MFPSDTLWMARSVRKKKMCSVKTWWHRGYFQLLLLLLCCCTPRSGRIFRSHFGSNCLTQALCSVLCFWLQYGPARGDARVGPSQ